MADEVKRNKTLERISENQIMEGVDNTSSPGFGPTMLVQIMPAFNHSTPTKKDSSWSSPLGDRWSPMHVRGL